MVSSSRSSTLDMDGIKGLVTTNLHRTVNFLGHGRRVSKTDPSETSCLHPHPGSIRPQLDDHATLFGFAKFQTGVTTRVLESIHHKKMNFLHNVLLSQMCMTIGTVSRKHAREIISRWKPEPVINWGSNASFGTRMPSTVTWQHPSH